MNIQYTFPHTLCLSLIGLIEHASAYIESCLSGDKVLTPGERFALASILASGPESHRTLQAQIFETVGTASPTATLAAPSPYLLPAILILGAESLQNSMQHLDELTAEQADGLRQLHDHDIPAIRDAVARQTPSAPLLAA